MGLELSEPIVTDACRELNFTNEIGYGGHSLLKNIIGPWLVQECRRAWAAGATNTAMLTWPLAASAETARSVLNPSDPRFLAPDNMPQRIAETRRETGQPVRNRPGFRCALESLALLYARTLREAEKLVGWQVEKLHIVGGGSRNALLNQLTADAYRGRCGPTEATVSGNVLGGGQVSPGPAIVRNSFDAESSGRIPHRNWSPFGLASTTLRQRPALTRHGGDASAITHRTWCRMGDGAGEWRSAIFRSSLTESVALIDLTARAASPSGRRSGEVHQRAGDQRGGCARAGSTPRSSTPKPRCRPT